MGPVILAVLTRWKRAHRSIPPLVPDSGPHGKNQPVHLGKASGWEEHVLQGGVSSWLTGAEEEERG